MGFSTGRKLEPIMAMIHFSMGLQIHFSFRDV